MLSKVIESIDTDIPFEEIDIDIDENQEYAKQFGIRGVPTLIMVDRDPIAGLYEIKRTSGLISIPDLKAWLNE
jgi:thioredoxin-like negative regulator of GroEL